MKKYFVLSGVLMYAAFLLAPVDQVIEAQWQCSSTDDDIAVLDNDIVPATTGIALAAQPHWQHAQQLAWHRGLRVAHFGIHADDAIGRDLGVDIFIATGGRKRQGRHNLKISILQEERGSAITVYDKDNNVVTGQFPFVRHAHETRRVPLLPWRDGMTIYYSVLLQTIEGKPYVVVVQHTRSTVLASGEQYQPAAVANMLKTYTKYSVLHDRLYGFLDEVAHMRLLPLPHTHDSYQFPLADDVYVTWAATKGAVRITPRGS